MHSLRLPGVLLLAALLGACSLGPAPASTATATVPPTLTLTLLPTATATIRPSATPKDCSSGWAQLKIGDYALVTGEEGDPPIRVRSGPGTSYEVIAQIYPGIIAKVVEGPVCADGFVYWRVENYSIPDGNGWAAEGNFSEYFMARQFYEPQGENAVAYNEIAFTVPLRISPTAPEGALCPAQSGGEFWLKSPRSLCFYFSSYVVADSAYVNGLPESPRNFVKIFERQAFAAIDGAAERIQLIEKQAGGEIALDLNTDLLALPALPHSGSNPEEGTLGEVITFGSGRGVRAIFLKALPAMDNYLLYAFTGLTDDGKYVVSVQLPIRVKSWSAYYGLGLSYSVEEINSLIDQAALTDDFYPSLAALDQLVASIRVSNPAFP